MKKSLKYSLMFGGGVLVAGLLTTSVVLNQRFGSSLVYDYEKQHILSSNKDVKEIKYEIDNIENKNIDEILNSSDINVFFVYDGVQAYYNAIRLAMLSHSTTKYYYSSKSNLTTKTDFKKLEEFIKTKRNIVQNGKTLDPKNVSEKAIIDEINKESSVDDLGFFYDTKFYTECKKLIIDNPKKKINIWVNSDNMRFHASMIELAFFDNVQIHGLEDSNIIGEYWYQNYYQTDIKNTDFDPLLKSEVDVKEEFLDQAIISRAAQYLIPTLFKNIYFHFSNPKDINNFKVTGLKNMLNYFNDSTMQIKDLVFSQRNNENKRIYEYWPAIVGVDWEVERDKVLGAKEFNNKKSMIILGTSEETEKQFLYHLVNKYQDEYNIFYKGHPGHNKLSQWFEETFVPNSQHSFNSLEDGSTIQFTVGANSIITSLESQIRSEELTTEHVFVENKAGLWFDKWALSDPTTSAINGIGNKMNFFEDTIEMLVVENGNQKAISSGSVYETYIQDFATRFANKNITVEINENNLNKAELELSDFKFNIKPDQGLTKFEAQKVTSETSPNGVVSYYITGSMTYENVNKVAKTYTVVLNFIKNN